jgi:hypothetical protein
MASDGAPFGIFTRQSGDDRLHARLAKSAARLLVGEDRLQLHDLAGERLDVALRDIDDGQPLLQFGQALMRGFGLLGHGLAETAGHGVETLADRLRQLRLASPEHFGNSPHAALHLGLALQYAGHPRLRVARMVGGFRGGDRARLGRPPQRNDQRHEQAETQQGTEGQRVAERDRGGAKPCHRLRKDGAQVIHVDSIADSACWHRSKRERPPLSQFRTENRFILFLELLCQHPG